MTTANEMAEALGKHALWHKDGVQWRVGIIDARVSWGKLQYQLVPYAGVGEFWADADSVSDLRDYV